MNPAIVARSLHSPALVLAAWGLGGVVALLGALVYAELAARNPDTGGDYAYLRDTYGPLPAFLVGWTLLLVVQSGGFQTPGHPWTTGAFMLACLLVIASTFWAFPINSLIGYGVLLLGVPPYLYWRRANRAQTS